MDANLSKDLQATRDMLMRSLPANPAKAAPPIPSDLLVDFRSRFAKTDESAPAAIRAGSWFESLRSLFASPGFGVAAAAVLLLGVAGPLLIHDTSRPEEFRGSPSTMAIQPTVRIFLVGDPGTALPAIEASGSFESESISTVGSLSEAMDQAGSKVIVDLESGTVRAIDASGAEIQSAEIPADQADLPAVIAEAASRL